MLCIHSTVKGGTNSGYNIMFNSKRENTRFVGKGREILLYFFLLFDCLPWSKQMHIYHRFFFLSTYFLVSTILYILIPWIFYNSEIFWAYIILLYKTVQTIKSWTITIDWSWSGKQNYLFKLIIPVLSLNETDKESLKLPDGD